jgi:stringent starvation protein B
LNYHIVITVIKLIDVTVDKVFLGFIVLNIGITTITKLNLMLNIIKCNIIYLYKQ